jgi:hypothetical protein
MFKKGEVGLFIAWLVSLIAWLAACLVAWLSDWGVGNSGVTQGGAGGVPRF